MPLRVVVWDAEDRLFSRRGSHDGRGGTAALAGSVRFGLAPAWSVGARVHAVARRLDTGPATFAARGVSSWEEALRFAVGAAERAQAPLTELQVWGHGGWGFMELGATRLDRAALAPAAPLAAALDRLRDVLDADGRVWLRCCSAFGGRQGRAFAPALARRLGVRVVGHTYVIGVLQSGTHSVAPGEPAQWSLSEGVVLEGGEPVRAKVSGPHEPRTLGCLRLDLPSGW